MVSHSVLRVGFSLSILILGAFFLPSYVDVSSSSDTNLVLEESQRPFEERKAIVPPRPDITVITGQGFGDQPGNALIAFAPDGRLLYYNNTYDNYLDVDPVQSTEQSVMYVAGNTLNKSACGATTRCVRNVVEIINLSTGESRRLYSRIGPIPEDKKTHDVDLIRPDKLLYADIAYDRVFIVNTSSNIIEWEWEAQQAFSLSGGGPFPGDWTHVNDVELLSDGRVMVSLRNQDQVVFIDPQTGLQERWTVGGEGQHEVLFEQHNPDYIPPDDGGPAVLIADSQNNRLVEYQRIGNDWERTWTWRDSELRWPRDADRLPNGNTLIVDTNGGRVLEINSQGRVIWTVNISSVYDAERLGTGDESAGGSSAQALDLESRVDSGAEGRAKQFIKRTFPPKIVNALKFIFPGWAEIPDMIALAGIFGIAVIWGVLELWWQPVKIVFRQPIEQVRWPFRFERK